MKFFSTTKGNNGKKQPQFSMYHNFTEFYGLRHTPKNVWDQKSVWDF